MSEQKDSVSWYESVCEVVDNITSVYSKVQKMSEIVKPLVEGAQQHLAAVKAVAPEVGTLTAMFPKLSVAIQTVGGWITNSFVPAITGAFGTISTFVTALAATLGISVGALVAIIVAVVAAVAALVAAIVIYWDEIVVFFTETLPQLWEDFTAWLSGVAAIVGGFFVDVWDSIVAVWSDFSRWMQENVIQPVLDFLSPITEWFTALFSSVWQTVCDIVYNIGVLIRGTWQIIVAVWQIAATWFDENVIKPVAEFFVGLWENISAFAASAWETIKSVFFTVAAWFDANVIQPVANFFTGLWTGFLEAAQSAWDAVKNVFSAVTGFFKDIFSKAWEGVVKVFSVAGEIFTNLKEGILGVFKKIVNGLIEGINKVVSIPFNGINGALEVVKNIKILGLTPFAELRMISVPQIPYLAQGAVLPANKPFLAMVGDQKHGTNVEAPLATIQEAVALVMEDMVASNMAGHEATVAALRQILQAVMGIRVGDEVLGRAVDRYHSKMAVIHGGM